MSRTSLNASYGVLHTILEMLKLNWLPVEERRDYNLLTLTFKALHAKQWPLYLNLQRVPVCRCLGSIKLQVALEKGTFQDTAAALFNNLPDNPKKWDISIYLVCAFLNS